MAPKLLDPRTFQPAAFDGTDFQHFADPEHEDCFFCNSRGLLVRPLAVTDDFVLMAATTRLEDGTFVIIPGCWLIFPRHHATTLDELPDTWTRSVKQAVGLLRELGFDGPFCTGENWERPAGQTVLHAHTWIILRGDGEAGLLSENTGLATILLWIKQHGITKPSA